MGPGHLALGPEAKAWQGRVSAEGWTGPPVPAAALVGQWGWLRAGGKVQAQALDPRDWDSLAWPSWLWVLLCILSWGGGGCTQGTVVGTEPGVREPATLSRPDSGEIEFQPSCIFGWIGWEPS